eukprot:Em0022g134a
MPSDGTFGFRVLVAGQPIPEYSKDGKVYVESDLCTPVSYYQEVEEFANGERELQRTPVTPYKLLIHLGPLCETSAIFVYVDGVQVARFVIEKNQTRVLKGFEEKTGIREFLFALPKLESDGIADKTRSHVGTIEVLRHEGSFIKEEYRPVSEVPFIQASKASAQHVTGGRYTMSTTKKGRLIHRSKPYTAQLKTLWKIGRECGRLSVHYRMPHCLREMDIELKTVDWSKVLNSAKEVDSNAPKSPVKGCASQ